MLRTPIAPRHRLFSSLAVVVAAASGAAGCAAQPITVSTPRFALTYPPDEWTLVSKSDDDGKPTIVKVGYYGDADVSFQQQAGMTAQHLADIEVRLYGWPENPGISKPSMDLGNRLIDDPDLGLRMHAMVMQQPPECSMLPNKKYRVFGVDQEPVNLVMKPKWRTILVAGQSGGTYLGVVARVPYEQDAVRYCGNLNRMIVELQHVLDNVKPAAGAAAPAGGAGAPAAPAAPPAAPPPAADPAPSGGAPPATPPPPPQGR